MACGVDQADVEVAQASETPEVSGHVSARRLTSVLFGDLVGFTSLSEQRDHEEVRELLTTYFDMCRRIIERYGGTVEKFIGDAVMAVWGVPTAHEDDAERAVRAGLELVNEAATMGAEIGVPELAMRVGIVTGEVAVTVGAEHQGMVAGDAVNTAARVQAAAAPGQVWVDETTRLLTASAITFVDAGSHQLKGKAEPMPLWAVRAVVAAVGGAQRADGLEAPLVGRDRELRLVKELFHRSEEQLSPSLLLVSGEPGLGKTRLAWEFEKYADGLSQGLRWHSGRCLAYGEGVAFYALAEAVRGRLRLAVPSELADSGVDAVDDDPAGALTAGLEAYVADAEERDWLAPRVGALLGIGSLATFPREDLFNAWTRFLVRVADGKPLVLTIDDAQHADDGLIEFLEHLLSTDAFPCFVLLLTRPGLLDRHPGLATNPRATVVHLSPLGDDDMAHMLTGLVSGLPEEACAGLVRRAEGVPLFAVETVRSLIDQDLVVPRGGQYVLSEATTLDLDHLGAPASLQALISARLDALDPEQRRVVDNASVLGLSFDWPHLAALCGDVADLESTVGQLVRAQILSRESSRWSGDYGQYRFVQSVVRQVAYSMLSRRDRRTAHLQVVDRLAGDGESAELAPVIAQHLLDAAAAMPSADDVPQLQERALHQLRAASVRASALSSHREAAAHLRTSIDLTTDEHLRACLQTECAQALVDAGAWEEVAELAIEATATFDRLGDVVWAGRAAAAHGAMLIRHEADLVRGREVVAPRWEALKDRDDADQALLVLGPTMGYLLSSAGENELGVLERLAVVAERNGDMVALVTAMVGIAIHFQATGADTTGGALLEAAHTKAREHHLPNAQVRCGVNIAAMDMGRDLPRAMRFLDEATAVALEIKNSWLQKICDVNALEVRFLAGQWTQNDGAYDSNSALDPANAPVYDGIGLFMDVVRNAPARPLRSDKVIDDRSILGWRVYSEALQLLLAGDNASAAERAGRAAEVHYEVSGAGDDFSLVWMECFLLTFRHGTPSDVERVHNLIDGTSAHHLLPHGLKGHRAWSRALAAQRAGAPSEEVVGFLREAIELYRDVGLGALPAPGGSGARTSIDGARPAGGGSAAPRTRAGFLRRDRRRDLACGAACGPAGCVGRRTVRTRRLTLR